MEVIVRAGLPAQIVSVAQQSRRCRRSEIRGARRNSHSSLDERQVFDARGFESALANAIIAFPTSSRSPAHCAFRRRFRAALLRPDDQHPSVAAARVSRPAHAPPARSRKA